MQTCPTLIMLFWIMPFNLLKQKKLFRLVQFFEHLLVLCSLNLWGHQCSPCDVMWSNLFSTWNYSNNYTTVYFAWLLIHGGASPVLLSGSKMLLGLKQDPHYGIHCTCIEVHLHFSWQDNLLFCDACDKGFHMEFLSPHMTETPTGKV